MKGSKVALSEIVKKSTNPRVDPNPLPYAELTSMAHHTEPSMIPYSQRQPPADPLDTARKLFTTMAQRRSVRAFCDLPVPRELIETIISTAGTAPSGANKQPWRFVAVQDPDLKKEIRIAAEAEEREFYTHRASRRWLEDLRALGTDEHKEFLERAPWLIAVFKLMHTDDGGQVYYVDESIGIAVGMLLTAAHLAGLSTLTHTPSPMKFLGKILNRPSYERPFLLIPVGYPAEGCMVPDIGRKPLSEIMALDRPGA